MCELCRYRRELQNECLLASKIDFENRFLKTTERTCLLACFDTAENEPSIIWPACLPEDTAIPGAPHQNEQQLIQTSIVSIMLNLASILTNKRVEKMNWNWKSFTE